MQRSVKENEMGPVTEMAIVDTFTKLIFRDEDYSERESLIIDALQSMHPEVHRDSYQEMGEYLRNLGVPELTDIRTSHFATKLLGHSLHAIADTQHRHS